MTKIFIATPAFDGRVHVQYALALADTRVLLASKGIEVEIRMNVSGSLLAAERNRLNKSFLESDCTHMLCVDSDLGWPPHAVLALICHDLDFVLGLYPARDPKSLLKTFLHRPFLSADESYVKHPNKFLFKVSHAPAGFMLIKRCVLESMTAHFTELYFEPKSDQIKNENGYALYNTEVVDGEFWGEDYVFCRRATECGYDIWIDPLIQFDHAGTVGCFAENLRNKEVNE